MKYLGVIIDDKFQFKNHCNYILKKIGKNLLCFLNRIGNFVSTYTRCIVYKSIIAPHFEYCAIISRDGRNAIEPTSDSSKPCYESHLTVQ